MQQRDTFATAINCMDGRVQLPVIEWMRQEYGVDYVDAITEPGPIKILAKNEDAATMESIRRRLDISVHKHGSRNVAVVAHYDCGGNPADKDTQLKQLASALEVVRDWNYDVTLVDVWVDERWAVRPVR